VTERSGAAEHPPYIGRAVAALAFMIVQCPVTAGFSWFGSRGRVKTWSDGWQKRAGLWQGVRRTGDASAHVQLTDCLSAAASLAQSRSTVIEMMQLTGMDHSEAREPLPNLD
jgi:hypothetical protein